MASDIGGRIVKMRSSRGWSQDDLGKRADLSAMTVSHYETGRRTPSVANLINLARAFRCSTDELLGLHPFEIGSLRTRLAEQTGERIVIESVDDLTTILKVILDQDHIPTTGYAARKAREMWELFAALPTEGGTDG